MFLIRDKYIQNLVEDKIALIYQGELKQDNKKEVKEKYTRFHKEFRR